MKNVLVGLFFGVCLGLAIANVIAGKRFDDACQARVSSAHFSLCLDSKVNKVKELLR